MFSTANGVVTRVSDRTVTLAPLWRELAVLAAFCWLALFFGLARFGLVGADEPRYAQIAREMLERHDWVVPVLYGAPWLEKPILYYWQAMISYSIFGVSDWAARLPVACDAAAMVLAVYFFVRRFRPGVQLDAALIVASMAAVVGFGRAASTDMPLAACFTIGMMAWFAWHETGTARWLAAFYVMMALGTLAKGPVAPVFAAAIISIFAALKRDYRIVLRTLWLPGVLLFLAVALPWYVAVQIRVPDFFRIFVLEHNLARYGSNLYRHRQPFWYYVPVLLLGLLPWTVLGITGLIRAIRTKKAEAGADNERDFNLFFAVWAIFPILFFSFSGSKLPGYILPALSAWAMLVAAWLYGNVSRGERANPVLLTAHSLVAVLPLATALLSQYFIYRLKPTSEALWITGFVSGGLFVFGAAMLLFRGLRFLRVATLLPIVAGIIFLIKVGGPAIERTESARPIAAEIRRLVPGTTPVAGFGVRREVEYGVAFYLNRPVAMYDRGEIPADEHTLLVRKGREPDLAGVLGGRRAIFLGAFDRRLGIYAVEAKK
jgi:4-amino-4-deoxy-L-arabinose transferase-like glycosyltransferase